MTALEWLAEELMVSPEEAALRLAKLLSQLPEKEREIFSFRLGLDGGELWTLEEKSFIPRFPPLIHLLPHRHQGQRIQQDQNQPHSL